MPSPIFSPRRFRAARVSAAVVELLARWEEETGDLTDDEKARVLELLTRSS